MNVSLVLLLSHGLPPNNTNYSNRTVLNRTGSCQQSQIRSLEWPHLALVLFICTDHSKNTYLCSIFKFCFRGVLLFCFRGISLDDNTRDVTKDSWDLVY